MASRVFALLIGIDDYKSGRIWNLEACADDARRMKQWLVQDLHVPSSNVAVLLNRQATKRHIEDTFMTHLVNNPDISQGDALLLYFAGHGSSMSAPRDWCEGKPRYVQVLCPYDHDTKGPEGRVAGISDRSLFAMLGELSAVKGDNITLILDCSFSSPQLAANAHDRRGVRCTLTEKARKEDLFSGLWRGAIGKKFDGEHGFYQDDTKSHTLLAACKPGEMATEWKEGGRFTQEFLAMKNLVPLHQLNYLELSERLSPAGNVSQHPVCFGRHKDRIIFDGIPFVPDMNFVPVEGKNDGLRLQMGAIHGVVEGTEFSVHSHNRHGSLNPSLDNFRVYEVHPTWSLARPKSINKRGGRGSWARITRWNARTPFRVYMKKTYSSLFRHLFCRSNPADELDGIPVKEGLNIIEVENSTMADISVGVHSRDVRVQTINQLTAPHRPALKVERKDKDRSALVIDEAARYHMHLHRTNPENPFRDQLQMELYLVDTQTQSRVGPNLLLDGKAEIAHKQGASYAVVLRNHSDTDLWPYLAYMDSNGVDIHLLYQPVSSSPAPTLPKNGCLEIGLRSLSLPQLESGFLKVFVSTSYTSLGMLEQRSTPIQPAPPDLLVSCPQLVHGAQEWDTALAILKISHETHSGRL
ncbi:hypothetical protein PAXRUDRAFT_150073 [Paxillus rubicundulus Ve08.2h10]|uniref:Peptidase C14 caspase domain-containing protein n=1 Tax=Paxillus rubicundulus Ve08.2h10 TaxID=930991 RepID=A0A0D0E2R1_9AGAM|nr:hypothetical protein PAXRUDRAFT_150073 [Paxillus rubicundulus Ve08.2h10]